MYFFYYYPIGVDVPRPRFPWVTLLLGMSMICLFTVTIPLNRVVGLHWEPWIYRAAQTSLLTPLTAVFLHAGWMHLAGNLLYLWVFGPSLEKALGRMGFLVMFCGTGYLGNLTQGAITVHLYPEQAWNGVIGASGAISGLLGLFMLRFYYARLKLAYWAFLPLQGINRTGTVHLPVVIGLLLWVLLQVTFALVERGGGSTAYGAHIGGLLTGLVLGISLGQWRRGQVERLLAQAERCRDQGNVHAAVGLLEKYLEKRPWDRDAWLSYARALRVSGDWGNAQAIYSRVVAQSFRGGRTEEAIGTYLEARRGNSAFVLEPAAQKRLAFWLEKTTRFGEAVRAYLDLARVYPDHEDREHALARAATLMITRLGQERSGRELLEDTIREFPDGRWRHWMENERRKLARRGPYAA